MFPIETTGSSEGTIESLNLLIDHPSNSSAVSRLCCQKQVLHPETPKSKPKWNLSKTQKSQNRTTPKKAQPRGLYRQLRTVRTEGQ